MWKYLIFDIDDTLLETFMNSYSIFQELGKKYWINIIDQNEFLELYMWWNFDKNIEHFFWKFDNIENTKQQYNELKKTILKKKFIDVNYLDKLSWLWYKYWVLTNGPEIKTIEKLEYLWIKNKCSIIFHSWNMNYKKPNPLVFTQVLKMLWVNPSDIIYVWDALVDYFAARDAWITFYAVLTWYTSKWEFIKEWLPKKFIYDDINLLLSFLLN
jgi:FMN phosphatase YigB (HAD superfamily)